MSLLTPLLSPTSGYVGAHLKLIWGLQTNEIQNGERTNYVFDSSCQKALLLDISMAAIKGWYT